MGWRFGREGDNEGSAQIGKKDFMVSMCETSATELSPPLVKHNPLGNMTQMVLATGRVGVGRVQ